MLIPMLLAMATAPKPTPTPRVVAAPYVPLNCSEVARRAGILGQPLTPRAVGVLVMESLVEHVGDYAVGDEALRRSEADVYGNENGPGCFNLHRPLPAAAAAPKAHK